MIENYRGFDVGPDPFGTTWKVEFRWSQNGISIRHADTIDVKFEIAAGHIREEKVIALPHKFLLEASHRTGHPITDPWCHRIAAQHLANMIETGEDVEKALVTLDLKAMTAYAEELKPVEAAGH
jgi:hypothetical protein